MLVLSRRLKEKICFPGIRMILHVMAVKRGVVQLGIEAPPDVTILREEVQARAGSDGHAGESEAHVAGFDHVLEVARAGLGLARSQLQAGRSGDADVLLDRIQGDLRRLRQRLRRSEWRGTPPAPRALTARSGPPRSQD